MIDMTDNDLVRSVGNARRTVPSTPEIIVGVDDDEASGAVLLSAAGQSRLTGLPLRVIHIWQVSALAAVAPTPDVHHLEAAAAADARARATRRVVDVLGSVTDVRWTLEVIQGTPGPALVARSASARLLVIGAGEHASLRRAVIGPVSRYAKTHATPPVLIVPTSGVVPGQRTGQMAGPSGSR
jgi:nucleotide-binding universal stress UspA family protein